MQSLTPVLFVECIEPVLPLWERLGFERLAEVPSGDALAFVMLGRGTVQVMYQSYASLASDVPELEGEARASRQFLYCRVDDLDATVRAIEGLALETVMPERKTFYGAREVSVRDAAGHVVTFAEHEGE